MWRSVRLSSRRSPQPNRPRPRNCSVGPNGAGLVASAFFRLLCRLALFPSNGLIASRGRGRRARGRLIREASYSRVFNLDSEIETTDSADFTDFEEVIGDERTNLLVTKLQGIDNRNLLYPCDQRDVWSNSFRFLDLKSSGGSGERKTR